MTLASGLPDVAPRFVGSDEAKEFILYARARFDRRNFKTTAAPLIFVATSGEGKTALLESLQEMFGCGLYLRGNITDASLGSVDNKDRETRVRFADMTLYDEIDKTSLDRLDILLQIFGAETSDKARARGKNIKSKAETYPVGCLLSNWRVFAEERGGAGRIQKIDQLLRRSAIMQLDAATQTESGRKTLIDRVVLSEFNLSDLTPLEDEIRNESWLTAHVLDCCDLLKDLPLRLAQNEIEGIRTHLAEVMCLVHISDTVSYSAMFPLLVKRLAVGRRFVLDSLALMATMKEELGVADGPLEWKRQLQSADEWMPDAVTLRLGDLKHVSGVLVDHAKRMGCYRAPEKEGKK